MPENQLSGLDEARRQIDAIRARTIKKHGWELSTEASDDDELALFVRMPRAHDNEPFLLRLVFGPGFPEIKPKEAFLDPSDPTKEGPEHWPDDGNRAFKKNKLKICLRGTYGCDNDLHEDEYDPSSIVVEETLIAIQDHIDKT